MPPRGKKGTNSAASRNEPAVADYRYDTTRKNIPPAGLAAQGKVQEPQKIRYEYNPHLPPTLRFDTTGATDRLPELLAAARTRKLTEEELALLAEALKRHEPWLEWAGKRESKGFEVDPVALHIHERVSTQAILRVAARQDVQRDLFADPQQEYREAVQFYQHDVDWANRMTLGDSLEVMTSLARREDLAGKVQMIYLDPPYGIKFASNFQPEVGKRDVKDKEQDLTREREMVKAYRDTWTLGVHSYLAYLRDRLMVAKELLTDSGSIFVQISDENLHRVRAVMEEVFGAENFVSVISFQTTSGFAETGGLSRMGDYLLWYGKNRERTKIRTLFETQEIRPGATNAGWLITPDGDYRGVNVDEEAGRTKLPEGARLYNPDNFLSQGASSQPQPFEYEGKTYEPGGNNHWKASYPIGMNRLAVSGRIHVAKNSIRYRRYPDDFPLKARGNLWTDTLTGSFTDTKMYVVQTNPKVIERCLLMATDPGDLVLDPTCGSGTTAYVAEQWGRRWITMDTSRVALALARQRLMTAKFDYFELRPLNDDDRRRNPAGTWLRNGGSEPKTLDCETVPHVTLKSIAQNTALDAIFAKHQPMLDEKLKVLNAALAKAVGWADAGSPTSGVGHRSAQPNLRSLLQAKLASKQKAGGKKAITEADRRHWLLPPANRDTKVKLTVDATFPGWYEWEVPFDTDADWPAELQTALTDYRAAWRAKMDEVNAAIEANAENEELVDEPRPRKNVVRVSGPFTMEAVMPVEESLDETSPIEGPEGDLEAFDNADAPANAEAFLDKMLRLLKADGVRFPNNKVLNFVRLDPMAGDFLHAEGEWRNGKGDTRSVAVSVGPEHGPVTAYQVENALYEASRRGVQDLVFAGFSFDGAAQAIIQDDPNPRVRCHLAHIRPDVQMGGLLKETPNSQLFTVFGSPRTKLLDAEDGMFKVRLEGVDIYNPVENNIVATNVDKVAAWFLDSDYDGRTFCITQAFFPDRSAWEKLAKALKGTVDESAFEALAGTESLPFPEGKHKRVAVKVIDPRGNEVMSVHRLGKAERY